MPKTDNKINIDSLPLIENHDPEDESVAIAYKLGFEHGTRGSEPEHKNKYYLLGHKEGTEKAEKYPTIYKKVDEENTAGSGAIAGIGVGTDGEPGINNAKHEAVKVLLMKLLRRKNVQV